MAGKHVEFDQYECDNPECDVEFTLPTGTNPEAGYIGTANEANASRSDAVNWYAHDVDCIEGAVKYVLELTP
jgi:hypothetical protein